MTLWVVGSLLLEPDSDTRVYTLVKGKGNPILPIHATCPSHHILQACIPRMIICEEHVSYSPSLWSPSLGFCSRYLRSKVLPYLRPLSYPPSKLHSHTWMDFSFHWICQWLRCCATNRKVAGSIPDGVIGIFHWSFRSHYGPGVDSASNRNEYQENFLGVNAAGA